MKVSFIVPTRNSARTLEACLASLRGQTHDDVEVVVVDNHSDDATPVIAARLADQVITAGPERSAQRNIGAWASAGEVVMFVDSDMVLEPEIATQIVDKMADPRVGALYVPELAFGDGFLAECRALEKRLYLGDPDVEAVRAIRREHFEAVGGWDEDLTAGEDWDLSDRLRAVGVGCDRVGAFIWHDEGRVGLRSQFSKKRYYGKWVADYLDTRGSTGRSKLARTSLFAHPGWLLRHPVQTAGLVLLKLYEGAGLAMGICDGRRMRAVAA